MHWIVQGGYYRRDGFDRLIEALDRMKLPFDVLQRLPNGDFEPVVAPAGPVIACGSLTLGAYAKRRGWTPGSFHNANHDVRIWLERYGSDYLNDDAAIARLDEVEPRWPRFFVRPCGDTKTFAGGVFSRAEFASWRASHDGATVVAYAPVRTIFEESRFFVVDGEIVAQSVYRLGGQARTFTPVASEAVDFARAMIGRWQPARGFVLDIARVARRTEPGDEHRVVEINALNGSAFYGCDVRRIVEAVEAMDFDTPPAC